MALERCAEKVAIGEKWDIENLEPSVNFEEFSYHEFLKSGHKAPIFPISHFSADTFAPHHSSPTEVIRTVQAKMAYSTRKDSKKCFLLLQIGSHLST